MKTIINSLAAFAVILFAVSCTPTVDPIFEGSSVERADAKIAEDMKILTSAPNGWRMEYYGATTYGGYNVFMSFGEDNKVTIASEKVGAHHAGGVDENGVLNRCTSAYRMEQSQGIILSFCEYNDIFHYFSEPKNIDYGTAGEGFYGDFEFRVISCSADSVVMKGRKHESKIVMYPMPADQTWEQAHNEIVETEKFMASRSYSLIKDDVDQDMYVYTQYRRLVFQYYEKEAESKDSTLVAKSVPYVVTKEGFKFYKDITVNGITITSIDKGDTDEYFKATNDHNVLLWAYVPSIDESLRTGTWFVSYSQLGDYAQPLWDKFKTALKKAGTGGSEATCYWAMLGNYGSRSDDYKVGIHCQAGDAYLRWGAEITPLNDKGTEVNIKNNTGNSNTAGKTFYKSYSFSSACDPFVGTGSKGRNFRVTTDNIRKPSYIELTEIENPKNVIRLMAQEVDYPFDH